jgi:hypothetical protein
MFLHAFNFYTYHSIASFKTLMNELWFRAHANTESANHEEQQEIVNNVWNSTKGSVSTRSDRGSGMLSLATYVMYY